MHQTLLIGWGTKSQFMMIDRTTAAQSDCQRASSWEIRSHRSMRHNLKVFQRVWPELLPPTSSSIECLSGRYREVIRNMSAKVIWIGGRGRKKKKKKSRAQLTECGARKGRKSKAGPPAVQRKRQQKVSNIHTQSKHQTSSNTQNEPLWSPRLRRKPASLENPPNVN